MRIASGGGPFALLSLVQLCLHVIPLTMALQGPCRPGLQVEPRQELPSERERLLTAWRLGR